MNFKINSRPFFTIIFKLKNDNFKTRDFSPLIETVLAGVQWLHLTILLILQDFDECDLKAQKLAKSVQRWMGDFFRRYRWAKRARQAAYKLMKLFDQLLRKSSRLNHEIKDKLKRCKEELYEVKSISSKNFLSRSARSPCPGNY